MSEANGKLLLNAIALSKTYRMGRTNLEVLRGVDLQLSRGEFVALCGASGSGKSTLLHLLGGIDQPSSGEIYFENHPGIPAVDSPEHRRHRVGFVFQAYHLLPELDAMENVCLPARVAGMPWAKAEAAAKNLLGRVGLSERMEHRPAELSGGEQQRVAIARALINSPLLVLADEPTGNLDSHSGEEILQLLKSIQAERGMALIVATHDSKVAAQAGRVLHLRDGVLVPDEPPFYPLKTG